MASELEKTKARDIISESATNFLTCKITLPLGNKDLKKVHTNQFLWTELPSEFALANWETIAEAVQGRETRYQGSEKSGYTVNRWYIESVDISVEANGRAEMQLGLNAFPSATKEYTDGYHAMVKAYNDAFDKSNNTNTTKTSSGSKKTNATTKTGVLNKDWIKKYNISSTVTKQVEKICKTTNTDYGNVKAIFKWMDDHLPYEGYGGTKYGAAGTLKHGKGNCCDHAHLFAAMCRSIGVKCNYIHNSCCGPDGHVYNKVYINGKSYIVDTGRDCASWGSHWGNAGCPVEKTSINF